MGAPLTARPAAGPVAAQAGAAAAGLVADVARAAGQPAGAAQATALATRLERLALEDAAAFAAATAALEGSGRGATPNARRDFALGHALDEAAGVPLLIAEACADVATLARDLATRGDPIYAADLESCARIALGAAGAAAHLVEINLAVGADDERAVRARGAAGVR